MSFVELETISVILQITIVIILILSARVLARGGQNKKNLIRHGYLIVFVLVLHTITVILAMIFLAMNGFLEIAELPFLHSIVVLAHIALGTVALGLGYIIVGTWLLKHIANMNCYKAKRIMYPTLLIWITSLIIGLIIHFLELF